MLRLQTNQRIIVLHLQIWRNPHPSKVWLLDWNQSISSLWRLLIWGWEGGDRSVLKFDGRLFSRFSLYVILILFHLQKQNGGKNRIMAFEFCPFCTWTPKFTTWAKICILLIDPLTSYQFGGCYVNWSLWLFRWLFHLFWSFKNYFAGSISHLLTEVFLCVYDPLLCFFAHHSCLSIVSIQPPPECPLQFEINPLHRTRVSTLWLAHLRFLPLEFVLKNLILNLNQIRMSLRQDWTDNRLGWYQTTKCWAHRHKKFNFNIRLCILWYQERNYWKE